MDNYHHFWTKILRILALPILLMVIAVIVYPKEADVQNVHASVKVSDEEISIIVDSTFPWDKFYDYQIEDDQQTLSIFVRWSPFVGKNGPQTLVIPNRFPAMNMIVLKGKNNDLIIFRR